MIIVDTNVVSAGMRPLMNPTVKRWLDGQAATDLYLAATSLAELRLGIEILPLGKQRTFLAGALEAMLKQAFEKRVLAFDSKAAWAYGEAVERARFNGRAIGIADGQLAAIAKTHGFAVATRDPSPFEAAGVAVINPWDA